MVILNIGDPQTLTNPEGMGKLLVYSKKNTIFFKATSKFPFETASHVSFQYRVDAVRIVVLPGCTRRFYTGRPTIAQ
jgi:hypothetical protein